MRLAWLLVSAVWALPGCPGPSNTDTGPGDVGLDVAACTSDAACDDGAYCNGTETCVAGTCTAGTPIACDDGVDCTTDRCSESRRACLSSPLDADGDGSGAMGCADGDDCDDADPDRFPGNFERCDPDGHDDDCDPTTLGGIDEDGDGFVSAACCNPAADGGAPVCGDDCNDAVAQVRPGAVEVCNLRDDDCDGMDDVTEGLAVLVYPDADRDGWGDAAGATRMACTSQPAYSVRPGDCDDTSVARNPGQPEFCDGLDNDCDPDVDEDAAAVDWYADVDGDGFGDAADVVTSCAPIGDRSLLSTDCNDAEPGQNPAEAETCNGVDDDCNGLPDAPTTDGTLEDDDLDGLADLMCPGGTDCDDGSAAVGAGEAELCDGRDNDCDGSFDEDVAMTLFYGDRDGDGYGSIASGAFVGCGAPPSYVADGTDCADADAARHPGTTERCNGVDDDCDGAADGGAADRECAATYSGANVVSAVCEAGDCVLRCGAGAGDCDGDLGNGCEDALSSAAHCGACGRTCSSDGAEATSCSAGECAPLCLPGRGDCNTEGADGCEASLDDDVRNCGACGARCVAGPRASTSCDTGTCRFRCDSGFFDCDGSAANGCESATACVRCTAGTQDCDGDGTCEDLLADPLHCGSCSRVCGLGGSCSAGSCDQVIEVAVGDRHTCLLRSGGQVLCWGSNDVGQVDPGGDPAARPMPVVVSAIDDALHITAGRDHTCAHRASGVVTCWGDNRRLQLGAGPLTTRAMVDVPLPPGSVHQLDAGGDHTCAAVGASLVCWGENASGESGPGPNPSPPSDIGELLGSAPVRTLALADAYTCFTTRFSLVNCFGDVPQSGVVPYSSSSDWGALAMTPPIFADDVIALEAGARHVCAVTDLGGVYCRGDNGSGQLGDGSTAFTSEVVEATELSGARTLWAGLDTTCALLPLDRIRCVGGNAFGELGQGTSGARTMSTMAVAPMGLPRARILARGGDDGHVCAVDPAGRTYCWGHNSNALDPIDHRLGLGLAQILVAVPTRLDSLGY